MTPHQASQQLQRMAHISTLANFPPKDLAMRQSLIRIVEDSTLDRTYEADRNRLIPKAASEADALTVAQAGTPEYCPEWSRHFLSRMTELAKGI